MANVATRIVKQRAPGEVVYGALLVGAITNGDYDLALEPGLWSVVLFVNADGTTAGTITASPINGAGTALNEEMYVLMNGSTSLATGFSLIDLVGPLSVISSGGTSTTGAFPAVGVYAGIRFTIASIGSASASNRIDYVATRLA